MRPIAWSIIQSAAAASLCLAAVHANAQPANPKDVLPGYERTPESSFNTKLVGHVSLQSRSAYKGNVQKQGDRYIAYIGHHTGEVMNPLTGKTEPNGTSIVDVTDPASPNYLHHLPAHSGEKQGRNVNTCAGADLPGGEDGKYYLLRGHGNLDHELWDVTDPSNPQFVNRVEGPLEDNHKNYWDCKSGLAFLTGTQSGWNTRSTSIYDLSDPQEPGFVRIYGLPNSQPGTNPEGFRMTEIHEPLVYQGRVYMAYGTGADGIVQILDLEKLTKGNFDPREPTNEQLADPILTEVRLPSYWGAHSVIPMLGYGDPPGWDNREKAPGQRDYMAVISEETGNDCSGHSHDLALFYDITDLNHPVSISNYYAARFDAARSGKSEQDVMDHHCDIGGRYGTHSAGWNYFESGGADIYHKKIMWISYFNGGARAVDVTNPYNIREVGFYIPPTNEESDHRNGKVAIQTNNLDHDERGYVYLFDRANAGMHIIVPTEQARALVDWPAGNPH